MFLCCHPGTFSSFFIRGCNIEDHDFVKRYNTRSRFRTIRPERQDEQEPRVKSDSWSSLLVDFGKDPNC